MWPHCAGFLRHTSRKRDCGRSDQFTNLIERPFFWRQFVQRPAFIAGKPEPKLIMTLKEGSPGQGGAEASGSMLRGTGDGRGSPITQHLPLTPGHARVRGL
jgi:hypothetical protein